MRLICGIINLRCILLLLRHGEAEREAPGKADKDADHRRRLTSRGTDEAADAGFAIAKLGVKIGAAFVSDAVRTTETFLAAQESACKENVVLPDAQRSRDLYLAESPALKRSLAKMVAECEPLADVASNGVAVLVVGHNPGLSSLATELLADFVSLGTGEWQALKVEADSWTDALDLTGGWESVF